MILTYQTSLNDSLILPVFATYPSQVPIPTTGMDVLAEVDTGAARSVIRTDIPRELGLNPVGITFVNTPTSSNVPCFEYLVRLAFSNRTITRDLRVIAADLWNQRIQCLIGRDVLKHCILVYNGPTKQFTLGM